MDTTLDSSQLPQHAAAPWFAASTPMAAGDFWEGAPALRRTFRNPKTPITRRCRRSPLLIALSLLLLLPQGPGAQSAEPAEPALNQLSPEQAAGGWISLFDGETLFGWTPTSKANWKVEDGAITVGEGEPGFLMTNSEFANYELHVEFKAPASTNSGIFLRTPLKPTDPAKDCYELNIAPTANPFPTGSLVGRKRFPEKGDPRAAWATLQDQNTDTSNADPWDGQWHSIDVTVNEGMLRIELLELVWHNYADEQPLHRGHIGLQFREGPVAFRNIRLRPLGLKPMLNGNDLSGWNADQKRASQFEVVASQETGTRSDHPSLTLPVEGRGPEDTKGSHYELHVTGGSGQLESDASYGDFTFQFDCRVDGDRLNSGIFFRCIPREYMQGYECQIHNGMKNGDPTRPTDFGTGAIYRRVAARRIVARDHEWFTTTVNAVGPHIAVWVNGYQVTDWTDPRPASDNPREGLRTAPGTIAIQGHDPTTDLRFRNLGIAELPKAAD